MADRLGPYVQELRERSGLTKLALARRADVSDGYIVAIENHGAIPSERVLRRLAAALDVMPELLLHKAALIGDDDLKRAEALFVEENASRVSISPDARRGLRKAFRDGDVLVSREEAARLGPAGWTELGKGDQTLVQRLVDRLRATDDE
jgi:transcriptional regulator with XRE-family HTH domain